MNKNIMKNLDIVCAVLFALFYVFPLVLGNNYYEDDLFRNTYGMSGTWLRDGRPFTFLLMMLLSGHFLLCNVAPLYLLSSSILLAYSGTLLARKLLPCDDKWFGRACISTVMIISPFFLQNLSYQYDVLSMSIAQFLAVYVALKITDFTAKNFLIKLGLIFILFGLYQPSLNTYMALSLILSMETITSIKKGTVNFLTDIGIAGIVSFMYVVIIRHVDILHNEYSDLHGHLIPFNKEGVDIIILNAKTYMLLIKDSLLDSSLFYLFIASIWALCHHIFNVNFRCKSKMENAIYVIYPFIIPLLLIGPLILLQNPVYQPRVCVSFCSILLFVFYTLYNNNSLYINNKKIIVLTLFLIFPLVFIMYSYGNTLTQHTRSEIELSEDIMSKLRSNGFQENKRVLLLGYGFETTPVNRAKQNHPVFKYIIKNILDTQNTFSPYILRQSEWLPNYKMGHTGYRFSTYKEDIVDCYAFAKSHKPDYLDDRYALYRNNVQHTYCVLLNHNEQSIDSDNMGWLDIMLKENNFYGAFNIPVDWTP